MTANAADPTILAILQQSVQIPLIYYIAIIVGLVALGYGVIVSLVLKHSPSEEQIKFKIGDSVELHASSRFAGTVVAVLGAFICSVALWKARPTFTYNNPNGPSITVAQNFPSERQMAAMSRKETINIDQTALAIVQSLARKSPLQGKASVQVPSVGYEVISGFALETSAAPDLSSAGIPFVEIHPETKKGQTPGIEKFIFVPETFLDKDLVKNNPGIVQGIKDRIKTQPLVAEPQVLIEQKAGSEP